MAEDVGDPSESIFVEARMPKLQQPEGSDHVKYLEPEMVVSLNR